MSTEKETKDSHEACPLGFDIGGMHCAACSSRIERVVGRLDGVDKVSVNLATAKAKVWTKPGDEDEVRREVMERVAKLGFRPRRAGTRTPRPSMKRPRPRPWRTGGNAWAVSGPCSVLPCPC
mgnify:CR=1 FL=1